jgi:uncharacterized protein YcfL
MKILKNLIVVVFMVGGCSTHKSDNAVNDQKSLEKTTAAIRYAFARGDIPAIIALHHPDVMVSTGVKVISI